MDAASVIAYYVMDGNRPLTAESNGNTTSYLYGLGVIGEETNTWSYSLTDGTNTQRQLTDSVGEVTYSARYTPWGDTLDTYGTGNFTFGYPSIALRAGFGGLMDNATGLLYVGNGQYYDPEIGRFLTRNPNASGNPYLPFDPTGALFVPLAFASLVYGKKKKKSKLDVLVIVALLSLSAGLGVAACGDGRPVNFTATGTVTPIPGGILGTGTAEFSNGTTATGSIVIPTSTPNNTPTPTCTPTLTPIPSTPTPIPELDRNILRSPGALNAEKGYDLYLAMYKADKNDSKNWWWRSGDFTIWKFMAIMWGYDAVLDMPLVRDAMRNRAKAFCPGGCDPSTPEGSLRYLTVFAQSGRDRIKAWKLGADPIGPGVLDYEPNIEAGTNIVEAVKSSNVDNINSLPAMAPFDYGNISLDYSVFPTMVDKGWVLKSLPATSGDTFFILSKCQYYFSQAVRSPKQDDPDPVELNQNWYNKYCG